MSFFDRNDKGSVIWAKNFNFALLNHVYTMNQNSLPSTLELLQSLVRIPAKSREENTRADFLQHYLEQSSLDIHRVGNNLWCYAWQSDASLPTLLLNSHIDTVPSSDSWTRPPFEPTIENGRLYGLGSNDAGAPLCSLVSTFLALRDAYAQGKHQSYNLVLGLSCQEEVTGEGGIDLLLKDMPAIDLAIVGEPTSMRVAVAEKGLLVLDCCAYGRSGHAAHNLGDNAIYKAIKDIQWFERTTLPKVSPLLGPVKMTVTIINAGSKHNVIPDTCRFTVDVRVNECYSNRELCDYIASQVACEVKARSYRLSSSGIDLKHPLVQRCREMGMDLYGSPTLSDQSRMPFPSVKLGPGDSMRSHTADEYVCIEEIEQALDMYYRLLDGLIF